MSAFGKKRFQAMAPLAGSMSDVTLASPTISSATITEATNLQVAATAKVTNVNNALGTDMANDGATVNLVNADHGKIFLCLLADTNKEIVLPANSSAARIGTQITIIQNADLIAGGGLTMSAGVGNTFSVNSFAEAIASNRVAATRPADANNRIIVTGQSINCGYAIGSKAVFTCVAANEWHFAITVNGIGSGKSDAIAFSTV